MNLTGKKILVTGGAGFIGGHLVNRLVRLKAKVYVIDKYINPVSYFAKNKLQKKSKLFIKDICYFSGLKKIIEKNKIEYLVHLAAESTVNAGYFNPKKTLKNNILGTVNVLEVGRINKNIKGIIVASSDKAYGKLQEKKYRETDSLSADHPYNVSKSASDLISTAYVRTYDLPVVITRFGNVYGEGDIHFDRIIPGIMISLINNKKLKIRSNGKYRRDYIYVEDVVDGYILLLKNIEKVKGEAYNFGSKENLSVTELIKLIEKTLNKKINYKILNIAKNEVHSQSLDYSKIKKMLKWQPKHSISVTVKKILSWYSKYLNK